MKFGFGSVPDASVDGYIDLMCLGEQLGFDIAWIPDQTFFHDPFVIIAAASERTSSIKLGVGVTNPYTRHPAQVARAAATLAEVTDGRVVIGFGAGNRKELLVPLGFQQDHAGPRCREAVQIAKALLAGKEVQYQSSTLVADGVVLQPSQPRNVPVYLAGRGRYVLRAAGELADGVIVGGLVSAEGIAYATDVIREGAESSDRSLDDVEIISWVSCYLTSDRKSQIRRLKPTVAHIIGGAPQDVLKRVGLTGSRIKELKEAYRSGGLEGGGRLVTEEEVDLFTIVGDAAVCRKRIAQLADAGITQLGLLLNHSTYTERAEFLRDFATDVVPAFQ